MARFFRRRKYCRFTAEGIETIDYKDLETLKAKNIHYLRGDWTNRDPEITELLKQHQRGGVPLYLYYDKTGKLEILPQILTEQRVLETFSR